MVKRWTRLLALGSMACLFALSAWAQTATTGSIEGRVRDQAGNPIANATVTAVANRAPVSAVTDSQGRYVLPNLPPGSYNVRAEASGKAAIVQEGITVSITARSRLDFTMVSGQTETVTVTAEAPVVDTKSVTTGGDFKVSTFIDQIPVGRNLAATLTLAPGVTSGIGTGAGNYSISGASGLENSYIVDGVNITNTGYGGIGSYNIVHGSLGTGVTYDFLEEVQVKTGGIDAEYGQATGGVINTVVKTGTNDLSGSVSLYAGAPINEFKQTSRFAGALNLNKGSWSDSATYDLGLSVGGPIVKDKLFYFVAYNPVQTKTSGTFQDIALPTGLSQGNPDQTAYDPPARYPAAVAGLQTQKRSSNNYAAKLTWYASPNHRLELSGFGDPSTGDKGPQRLSLIDNTPLRYIDYLQGGGQSEISYGANNYTLKYDGVFTPTLFMQAQIGRHDGKFEETSVLNKSRYTDQRQLRCFLSPNLCGFAGQSRDNAALWNFGGVGYISNQTDINNQAKAVITWVAGNNELKGGVEYDDIQYTDAQDYSGANIPIKFTRNVTDPSETATALANACAGDGSTTTPCYILLNSRGGVVTSLRNTATTATGVVFRSTRGRFNPTPPPTKTKDAAIFATDTWTFSPKWTLKAGLRANQQKIEGSGTYTLHYYYDDGSNTPVTTQLSGLKGTTPVPPGTYTFDWTVSPRVGLTWDTKGDGRGKIYLNAARYYERVPNDLAIRALSNEAGLGTTTWDAWDIAAGTPSGNQTGNSSVRGAQTRVEDGTKLPYVDEYVLGWQRELGRDVSYEIRGIYREQGRALEDVQFNSVEATENYYAQYYLGAVGTDIDRLPFPTYPSAYFGEYVLANPGENTPAGFPNAIHKYYALEFILNKRFSDHWMFYGNMRFSRLRGNYEGLFRNDNGQSDPNVTSLFDFPNSGLMAGQFESGALPTDVPFASKLYGSYQWDNGLSLGASLNVAAGTPRTPLLAHPNGFYQNAGEVPGINPVYYWFTTTGCTATTYCFTTGTATQFFDDPGAFNAGSWTFPHLFSYTEAKRGYLGRTNVEPSLDLSLSWQRKFNRWATFSVGATVFNVFNFRENESYRDFVELQAGVTDPDYLTPLTFQRPRELRAFARWSF